MTGISVQFLEDLSLCKKVITYIIITQVEDTLDPNGYSIIWFEIFGTRITGFSGTVKEFI